jgi:hypothetical protein
MSTTRLLTLILLLTLAPALPARDLTAAERLADFDQLVSTMRSTYGVLEYKKQVMGIDLDQVVAQYRPQIEAAPNDERFYALVNMFSAEFKDGHFGLSNPSNRRARLGFGCVRAEDKAVILWIDRQTLTPDVFPFAIGDELVALDGRPAARILEELIRMGGQGNEACSLQVGTGALTWRHGSYGAVPTGVVRVDVRKHAGGEVQSVMLPWIVEGGTLPGLNFHGRVREGVAALPRENPGELALNMGSSLLKRDAGVSVRPEGARTIEAKFFKASVFDTAKGPMGYIRIPDFMPEDTDAALVEMRRLLKEMWFTKGLVLDLNDNPGGWITYCYRLAALFTSKPLEMQTISMRANRRVLAHYLEASEDGGDVLSTQLFKVMMEQVRAAMEADRPMTEFAYPYGVSSIAGGAAYDKPIVVLCNERSISCGDIFPALMQDNERATLFGHTTGGAGGAVTGFGALPNSGIGVRMTINLWKRSSGGFIENHGVTPDIAYEHTQKDVAEDFKAYRAAYIQALMDLVK